MLNRLLPAESNQLGMGVEGRPMGGDGPTVKDKQDDGGGVRSACD